MKVLLSILLLVLLSYQAKCDQATDSLLHILKSEILKKKFYDDEKNLRIKTLKQRLKTTAKSDYLTQYELCDKLYTEYREYIFDSAYVYTRKLTEVSLKTHDIPKQYESKIKLGAIQLSWGMFKETFDCLNQINPHLLHDTVKLRYYELKSRAHTDLSFYNTDKFYSGSNRIEAMKALDSVLLFAKQGSYDWYKYTAERLTIKGQSAEAVDCYNKLMQNNTLSAHQRAMVTNDLSNLIPDGPEKTKLIIEAAIYDIKSSTKETLAIFSLGNILFREGNIKDAELVLKEALSQAQFYGNRLHTIEIVAILTTVAAQKLINSENRKNTVLTYLLSILVIAIIGTIIISLVVYVRLKRVRLRELIVKEKNQHLDKINKKLLEDSRIKEEYIGYFFNIISGYILKLEKLKRNTERKIKIKNYEELLQLANEIDIKQERYILFYTFDHIFLKLFPNFITVFNSLLKPEDQIWPKDNEVLTTNLRIFALMRLGIKDNQTIANILENTVSTIYTYKTRIKSKALIPGDEFDNRIMEIQFVDI